MENLKLIETGKVLTEKEADAFFASLGFVNEDDKGQEVKILTSKFEREVVFKVNGIIRDQALVAIEKDESDDYYTVVTYYSNNDPYAYREVEKEKEFLKFWEARKEARQRALKWEKRFKDLFI